MSDGATISIFRSSDNAKPRFVRFSVQFVTKFKLKWGKMLHVLLGPVVAARILTADNPPSMPDFWNPPPQTKAEKDLQKTCRSRLGQYEDGPFRYPLSSTSFPGIPGSSILVNGKEWMELPRDKRLSLMRDIECWGSGGRMDRRGWTAESAVDAETHKLVESYSVNDLWPKSGHYK